MKEYKGYEYIIFLNYFTCTFCAYVKLPQDQTNIITDDIPCHGGVTFSSVMPEEEKYDTPLQNFTPGYWIGWDYAHAGDFMPYRTLGDRENRERMKEEHVWQPAEIEEEIKEVIEYLKTI